MTRMLLTAAILLASAVCAVTIADDVLRESDFTLLDNGSYWKDGFLYTKSYQYMDYFDHHGEKCQKRVIVFKKGAQYALTQPAISAEAKVEVNLGKTEEPYKADEFNWRQEMLEIAKLQQEADYLLEKQRQDDAAFVDYAAALGLNRGNYPVESPVSGTNNPYALSAQFSQVTTPLAQQGNTLYTYNSFAYPKEPANLASLYAQAGRLPENAQELVRDSTGQFMDLVENQADVDGDIAKLQAKGEQFDKMIRALGNVLEGTPSQKSTSASVQVYPSQPLPPQPPVAPGQPVAPVSPVQPVAPIGDQLTSTERLQLDNILASRCLTCHGAEKQEGGYDLRQYHTFTQNQKRSVYDALNGWGPTEKVMPPDGNPLTFEEMQLFNKAWVTHGGQ